MCNICVFAGTSEGHELLSRLSGRGASLTACVATDYGQALLHDVPGVRVLTGRMDEAQMAAHFRDAKYDLVIDATHPYAAQATENIAAACRSVGVEYMRVSRSQAAQGDDGVFVPDVAACVAYLLGTQGNVFLTTGSKDLPAFCEHVELRSRLYARVLPMMNSLNICQQCGIEPSRIIAMQGPFDEAINMAMFAFAHASYMVTKDTGDAGGYQAKISAARKCGAIPVIIGRPPQLEGLSVDEAVQAVAAKFALQAPVKAVTLAGIGMGNADTRTVALEKAIRRADCLIGAKRMLDSVDVPDKRRVEAYLPQDVAKVIREDDSSRQFVVLLSGDTGFFSGAKRLMEALDGVDVQVICGISSMQYFMSRLGRSWEDVRFLSLHGRQGDIVRAVSEAPALFVLVGGQDGAKNALQTLNDAGLGDLSAAVGERLGYADETITRGNITQLAGGDYDTLSVLFVENPHCQAWRPRFGLPDEAFERDDTPMTKSEVRAVSMSKLCLTTDAVVYDVGSGSGSVTVECGLNAPQGHVYAIEMKPQALALTEKNVNAFGLRNVTLVEGKAPDALDDLPAPSHVFIGGSSGSMEEIINCVAAKNPQVRIVANAVTLESTAELNRLSANFAHCDVAEISVAKPRKLGRYHLMTAQNPVYVFALWND